MIYNYIQQNISGSFSYKCCVCFSALVDLLKTKAVPQRQHLRIRVPNVQGNGSPEFEAAVVLNLPNGFDVNARKKYPILIYVYGGPGNNQRYRRKIGSKNRQFYLYI